MWKTLQASVLWAALSLLAGAAPLFAQSAPPTMPDHTVYGRLGSGTGSGPGQAIPFATIGPLLLGSTSVSPNFPVIHPTLTNSGCAPAHSLLWNDNDWCVSADALFFTSTDPSALLQFIPTGSPTNGATVTLNFKFGVGSCISSGAGCTASTVVTNGETLAQVIAALVAAIQANSSLYNNVFGAQGQILAVSSSGTTLSMDFNSNVAMKVTFTDSASTITSNLPGACSTACTAALDTNPLFAFNRVPGAAPVANSQLFNIESISSNSVAPTTASQDYGQIVSRVLNSTVSSISSRWEILTPNTSGTISQGVYVGAGLYGVGNTDEGVNTTDFNQYWIAALDEIYENSGTWTFAAASAHPIEFTSTAGFGFGQVPSAAGLESAAAISTFSANTLPTAGSAWSLTGGAAPASYCENWTSSTFLGCIFLGLSFDFKPSNGTGGWTLAANTLLPDADNATAIGSSSKRVSTVTTQNLAIGVSGALKGNGTSSNVTQAACADLSNGGTACAVNTGTSGATVPLLNAASNTWGGNQLVGGQIFSTTGLPTIASGACGATTNGAVVSGSTNQSGQITIGSAATTTCTISWSGTLAQAPNACVFFPMNATAAATGTTVARVAAPTTGGVVLSGSALANANYAYVCI